MSVGYRIVSAGADGAALRLSFVAENRSPRPWRRSDGFAFGVQLIDPERHVYIEDGPRVELNADVETGGSAHVSLTVQLPPYPGDHQLFVSPWLGEHGWAYALGWPFLILDVRVENGQLRVLSSRVTTLRRLKAELILAAASRALIAPVLTLWRNRRLIRSMVRRDLVGRYRGSFAGLFWTLLNPLLLMLTYFFVFGVVLRTRFEGDPSRSGFALYFLAGMLPWLAFSEAAGRAPTVIAAHRNFVKKMVFPVDVLPAMLAVGGLVTQAFALLAFFLLLLILRGGVPVSASWLIAILPPQVLFTLGVCWFLAALGVHVRDLAQINGFLLTVWFFLTPICYPETSLPPDALGILSKNPFYVLAKAYRAALLEPNTGLLVGPLLKLWLVSILVFIAGHACFQKLRKSFADVI